MIGYCPELGFANTSQWLPSIRLYYRIDGNFFTLLEPTMTKRFQNLYFTVKMRQNWPRELVLVEISIPIQHIHKHLSKNKVAPQNMTEPPPE